jgi:ATP-dependent Lon protease
MAKILAAPLTDKERRDTVKLFDIYCNSEPHTGEYLQIRNHLIKILETYTDPEQSRQRNEVDAQVKEMMKKQPPTDMFGLKRRICELETTEANKIKLLGLHRELSETSEDSNSFRGMKEKLEWAVSLPYEKIKLPEVQFGQNTELEITTYCARVRASLDASLYGMKKAKDSLIGILTNRISNPRCPSMIGLKGPPGVGKTALCAAFAKAVGLPHDRIALGGMEEPSQLKGSDSHWVGSAPSIVLQKMRNMKVANGILGFDEIDKLGNTHHGRAVQDALLHITDYTQNSEFDDGFITEVPHNLSLLWFFFMFNNYEAINPILRNRITNVIDVDAYTHTDLKNIITSFSLPKCLRKVGIAPEQVTIEEQACYTLISRVIPGSADSGVRPIEDALDKLVTCINVNRVCTLPDGTLGVLKEYKIPGFKMPLVITSAIVEKFLEHARDKAPSYFS